MLANGELERMTEAGEILAVAAAWATERHSVRCLIEVNLLSIMRYVVLGESESALAELGRTVSLAKPGGVKRAFVEMGIALRPYLTMLLKRNFERAFVQEILAAYAPYPLPAAPDLPAKNSPNEKNGLPAREQVEAELTHRERDVLILLAEKRSNAEIAAALTVTLPTVKKHARNIYRKLHVNNRREAVARARMLGLLSSAEEYSF
jgi:LuxR family maltose regulon positive regulatory protein